MRKRIHVDQRRIRSNIHKPAEEREAPITVRTYKGVEKANTVDILGPDGEVLATIVYSPDKPLDCGARLWIETEADVRLAL